MIKLRGKLVKGNLVTDILSDVSVKKFGLRSGDLFKIHHGAMLELEKCLTMFGGILENNGIIYNKSGRLENNTGLLINNGLIINQGHRFGILKMAHLSNSNKIPNVVKGIYTSWAVQHDNSNNITEYRRNQNIDNEIAISRFLDTKYGESLIELLERKPLITRGIQNNGIILNNSQIILNDDTEFYNTQEGKIENYRNIWMGENAMVRNDGTIFSYKDISYENIIIGNSPIHSTEELTKREIDSVINEKLQNYKSNQSV